MSPAEVTFFSWSYIGRAVCMFNWLTNWYLINIQNDSFSSVTITGLPRAGTGVILGSSIQTDHSKRLTCWPQSGDMATLVAKASGSLPVAAASPWTVPFSRAVPRKDPCVRAAGDVSAAPLQEHINKKKISLSAEAAYLAEKCRGLSGCGYSTRKVLSHCCFQREIVWRTHDLHKTAVWLMNETQFCALGVLWGVEITSKMAKKLCVFF